MGAAIGIYKPNAIPNETLHLVTEGLQALEHRGTGSNVIHVGQDQAHGIRYHGFLCSSDVLAADETADVWLLLNGVVLSRSESNSSFNGQQAKDLLKSYLRKGESFLTGFDGSYSISIWDGRTQELILVRDRLGTVPLFYWCYGGAFAYATEIKALQVAGLTDKEVNLGAIVDFLSYGYLPSPQTMWESVHLVNPGHVLRFQNGKTSERPYWKFAYSMENGNKSDSYYIDTFMEIFSRAVERRVRRFPEAGALLSGGMDTSSVVATMCRLRGSGFKVFTAGFAEKAYDETPDAKVLADHLALDHHTVEINSSFDFPSLLEKLVWHHDAPFADTSAVPSYHVARLAKSHVDIVFTGDFPDQLLGGSGHHVHALKQYEAGSVWKQTFRGSLFSRLLTQRQFSAPSTGIIDKVKRYLFRESFPIEEQRIILNMPVPPLLKRSLYSKDLLAISQSHDPLDLARSLYDEVRNASLLDKLLYFDINSYAPDDLMVKVDRTAAMNGLLAISPFHDQELVEFIGTIPDHLKIRGKTRKYILREAFKDVLPKATLQKPKTGFAMPLDEWLTGKTSDYVKDILFDPKTLSRGYFNRKFMKKMVEDYFRGKNDYATGSSPAIICLLTLELWHRLFAD